MKHRILAVICALTLALTFGVFTGCQGSKGSVGYQLDMPQKGEEIAIMHTSMGDISIRFFPEAAPKAVENFKTHAKDGYYDGLTFHRVINDFMIQGGDPNGDGTGGDSIWGEPFEDEFSDTLFNIRGSLSMANSGPDTNGSQFLSIRRRPVRFPAGIFISSIGRSTRRLWIKPGKSIRNSLGRSTDLRLTRIS